VKLPRVEPVISCRFQTRLLGTGTGSDVQNWNLLKQEPDQNRALHN